MQVGLAEEWWSRSRDEAAHSDQRLSAAMLLAIALTTRGRYAEAEQMERQLLELQRRVLGREHPNTLTTTGNLAISLSSLGRHAEAERMQRELLRVQLRVLGAEHRDTLSTNGHLSASLSGQGKHVEAERMQRELLERQRAVLGAQHPDTMETTDNLAVALIGQGKHVEAELMRRELLEVQLQRQTTLSGMEQMHPQLLSMQQWAAGAGRENVGHMPFVVAAVGIFVAVMLRALLT
jgi:tetratricopeptide (TPR) repeat protein